MSLVETKPKLQRHEIAAQLVGRVYRERETGRTFSVSRVREDLTHVFLIDEHRGWDEVILTELTNRFEVVSKTTKSAVLRTITDHGGEIPTEGRWWCEVVG